MQDHQKIVFQCRPVEKKYQTLNHDELNENWSFLMNIDRNTVKCEANCTICVKNMLNMQYFAILSAIFVLSL